MAQYGPHFSETHTGEDSGRCQVGRFVRDSKVDQNFLNGFGLKNRSKDLHLAPALVAGVVNEPELFMHEDPGKPPLRRAEWERHHRKSPKIF